MNIFKLLLVSFLFRNCKSKGISSSSHSSSHSESESSSKSSTTVYRRTNFITSTYSRQTYYNYDLYPIPLYFIWFQTLDNPYISLDYESNNLGTQYCILENCNSINQQYIISVNGNYSINDVLANISNITNVTILENTLETNYDCLLNVSNCVTLSANRIKPIILTLLLTILCISILFVFQI